MKLGIGLATYRTILPETFICSIALDRAFQPVWDIKFGAYITQARNEIIENFLGAGVEYVLFLDADMVVYPKDVDQLAQALVASPERGAVSAYYVRWSGGTPVHNWRKPNGKWSTFGEARERSLGLQGVHEVDAFGAGCLLLSTEALSKLKHPYFFLEYEEQGLVGEDVYFCQKLKEAGFKPSVHFGVHVGHIGPTKWEPEKSEPMIALAGGRA